jgi:hypothetical protein
MALSVAYVQSMQADYVITIENNNMSEQELAELFDEFMTNLALNNGTTEY